MTCRGGGCPPPLPSRRQELICLKLGTNSRLITTHQRRAKQSPCNHIRQPISGLLLSSDIITFSMWLLYVPWADPQTCRMSQLYASTFICLCRTLFGDVTPAPPIPCAAVPNTGVGKWWGMLPLGATEHFGGANEGHWENFHLFGIYDSPVGQTHRGCLARRSYRAAWSHMAGIDRKLQW